MSQSNLMSLSHSCLHSWSLNTARKASCPEASGLYAVAACCFHDQRLPCGRQIARTWLISCRCSGQGLAELCDPCADEGAAAVSPTMPLLVSVAHAGALQTATSSIHPYCVRLALLNITRCPCQALLSCTGTPCSAHPLPGPPPC